jgi:pimeloyl-ACP methyl ester carboxylesterase
LKHINIAPCGSTTPPRGRPVQTATQVADRSPVMDNLRPQNQHCGVSAGEIDVAELADTNGTFVEVAERQIYYLRWPASGPSLVLIHGFGTANTSWGTVAPLLARAGYDTYALDLGGFGLSSKRWGVGYAHADQADLVDGWMQRLGMDSATVVGHSMGGNVAAHLALRHPRRVDRLVLEAPAVLSGLQSVPSGLRALLEVPALRQAARLVVRTIVLRSDLSRFEATNPLVLRSLRTADWDLALLAAVRDSRGNQLTPEQLRGITAPTLLLWGANDTTIPVADSDRLQAILPHARAVTIPGLGHLAHEEAPQRFVELVLKPGASLASWLAWAASPQTSVRPFAARRAS